MTASAPAAAASAAYAIDVAGVPEDTPTITGTRPSAARTVVSITSRRSAVVSDPASPIVPLATKPCTPACSSADRFASSAGTSMAPAASNGVVTAGMMPGKGTGSALLVVGHVAPHPLEVLRGVEGRGAGIAVHDRLVDHPVLGRVDAGAAGPHDRVVAQALPQRLVHQRGDVVGEAREDGVAGQRRELAVEAAVAVVPARAVAAGLGGVHGVEQRLGLGIAAAAARRERSDARLQQEPRLEQVERSGVVRAELAAGSEALQRVVGHE